MIIGGVRTPFVKAFGQLHEARHHRPRRRRRPRAARARASAARRSSASSGAASSCRARRPTWRARSRSISTCRPAVEAMTVTRACASGLQAITTAAAAIERGDADVMIAGGSDSTTTPRSSCRRRSCTRWRRWRSARRRRPTTSACVAQLWPITDILPQRPKIAERTTGEVMGEAADKMARRNEMSREAQDAFAFQLAPARGGGDRVGPLRRRGRAVEAPDGAGCTPTTSCAPTPASRSSRSSGPVFAEGRHASPPATASAAHRRRARRCCS